MERIALISDIPRCTGYRQGFEVPEPAKGCGDHNRQWRDLIHLTYCRIYDFKDTVKLPGHFRADRLTPCHPLGTASGGAYNLVSAVRIGLRAFHRVGGGSDGIARWRRFCTADQS